MLIYQGSRSAPVGATVWVDWNVRVVQLFNGRTSPRVQQLKNHAACLKRLLSDQPSALQFWRSKTLQTLTTPPPYP